MFIDSQTVFNVIAKYSTTTEKRLQLDCFTLRQSHARGELRSLSWIPSAQNLADGLTKNGITKHHSLWKVMLTNKIHVTPTGWISKSTKPLEEKSL